MGGAATEAVRTTKGFYHSVEELEKERVRRCLPGPTVNSKALQRVENKRDGGAPNHCTCADQSHGVKKQDLWETQEYKYALISSSNLQIMRQRKDLLAVRSFRQVFCFIGQVPEETHGKEMEKKTNELPQRVKSRGHN